MKVSHNWFTSVPTTTLPSYIEESFVEFVYALLV